MSEPERVVFDCNVFFQAFVSAHGPAASLLAAAADGRLLLYLSDETLNELKSVLARPSLVARFKFTEERVNDYLAAILQIGYVVTDVPHVFDFPRDPKDACYVDLALAAGAKLIVSRDKDLLSLRDPSSEAGRDFLARFPQLLILTPPELAAQLSRI